MTTPIDIAELRRLLANATPGVELRTYQCDRELVSAAVNSLGPLLDELEAARRENYDLRDGQFVPALTASRDAARAHVRELEAQCVEALADNVRLSAELEAARETIETQKESAAASEKFQALCDLQDKAIALSGKCAETFAKERDAARAEAAKLREALEEVVRSYDSVTRPDWVRNEAPWVTQARAALGKEKP